MTFEDWKSTARFITAGPEMPQHITDMDVKAAYVFCDGSFIAVQDTQNCEHKLMLAVFAGRAAGWYAPQDFDQAALDLWSEHAKDNMSGPMKLKEVLRLAVTADGLDAALRLVQDALGATNVGLAAHHFSQWNAPEVRWNSLWNSWKPSTRLRVLGRYIQTEISAMESEVI